MNYCKDLDRDKQPDYSDCTPPPSPDTLSWFDVLQARILYGGRPAQGLYDSAGLHTSSGWISTGGGYLAPEYLADGAYTTVFWSSPTAPAPAWASNIFTPLGSGLVVLLPDGQVPAGGPQLVSVSYVDPWGRDQLAVDAVEVNPAKVMAIMVSMGTI
jgi:hypothetical protein